MMIPPEIIEIGKVSVPAVTVIGVLLWQVRRLREDYKDDTERLERRINLAVPEVLCQARQESVGTKIDAVREDIAELKRIVLNGGKE